jgi:hypothetical protein
VVTTQLQGRGVSSKLQPMAGTRATLDLTVAVNQDATLVFEWGRVTFGDASIDTHLGIVRLP